MRLFLVWRYHDRVLLSPTPVVVEAETAEEAANGFYNGALVIEAQAFGPEAPRP